MITRSAKSVEDDIHHVLVLLPVETGTDRTLDNCPGGYRHAWSDTEDANISCAKYSTTVSSRTSSRSKSASWIEAGTSELTALLTVRHLKGLVRIVKSLGIEFVDRSVELVVIVGSKFQVVALAATYAPHASPKPISTTRS